VNTVQIDHAALLKAGIVAGLVLAGFLAGFSPPLVASVGAAVLLITRTRDPHLVYEEAGWGLLVFFVGLFLIVGVLYDRTHSRLLGDYGGVAALMPRLAPLALIVVLSSLALPGTNGFVGEFLILLGTFRANPVYAALASSGVILSAVYLLWMYQRVMQGPVAVKERARMTDLTRREQWLFIPLIALIFWIGVYPSPLLRRSEASVRALIESVTKPEARSPEPVIQSRATSHDR